MRALSYIGGYIFRLFVRRIVARIVDGDRRTLTGRAKRIQKDSGGVEPLSHAAKILAKTVFPIVATPYPTVIRLNGQFITGTIRKEANIYSGIEHTLGHPLAHNDAHDYFSKLG